LINTTQNGTWDATAGGCFNGTTVPTSSDDVTISHDVSGAPVVTCRSITLNGKNLTITGVGSSITNGVTGTAGTETFIWTDTLTFGTISNNLFTKVVVSGGTLIVGQISNNFAVTGATVSVTKAYIKGITTGKLANASTIDGKIITGFTHLGPYPINGLSAGPFPLT
jgi:hypothetical protein